MKILYAIQGTGNGHMARAYEVIPELLKYGQVDIAVSGTQCDIQLPWPIKYRLYGLSFIFGKNGGIDFKKTIKGARPLKLMKEIFSMPVQKYDIVLNDFEPVVAWACNLKRIQAIGLSHQSAVLHPKAPRPTKKDRLGENILRYYAPLKKSFGFHFKAMDKRNSTPVIRKEIRLTKPENKGHYTVYLPSYSDQNIIKVLSQFPLIEWQVFSKHNKERVQYKNIYIEPVNKDRFTTSFVNCSGILCNASFETPAEALYMGKKLCAIPMKGQYEQQCNAAFLEDMGVTVIQDFEKDLDRLNEWIYFEQALCIKYPNNISDIVENIIYNHIPQTTNVPEMAIN